MCEPVTISLIAGSAILSAYSKYREGQSEKAALEADARVKEMQAGDARQRGAIEAGMSRMQTSQTADQQKLQYIAAGVDPSTGTPESTIAYGRGIGEFKALEIENDAIRQAWGFEASASMSRYKGRLAEEQGKMGALSSIIGGGAQAAMVGQRLSVGTPGDAGASRRALASTE